MVKDNSPWKMLDGRLNFHPRIHPRKAEKRKQAERYKNDCLNGDTNLDPHAFDVLEVHDRLRDAFRDAFTGT